MAGLENQIKDLVSLNDQNPLGLYSDVEVIDSANTTTVSVEPGVIYLVDASSASVTMNLPAPNDELNIATIKKTDATGNAVSVATPGSGTIDGNSSLSITSQYTAREIVDDGTDYFIV